MIDAHPVFEPLGHRGVERRSWPLRRALPLAGPGKVHHGEYRWPARQPEKHIVTVQPPADGDGAAAEERVTGANFPRELRTEIRVCRLPGRKPLEGPQLGRNLR